MTKTAIDLAREVLELAEKATPGPWETDTISTEDAYGSYNAYGVFISTPGRPPKAIADSINADESEIHSESDEDDIIKWDEVARKNFAFIAHSRTSAPAIASALLSVQERLEKAEGLLKRTEASLSALDKFGFTDATWHTAMENRDAARAFLEEQSQ